MGCSRIPKAGKVRCQIPLSWVHGLLLHKVSGGAMVGGLPMSMNEAIAPV